MPRPSRIRPLYTALRLSAMAGLYAVTGCTEHTGAGVVEADGFGIVTELAGESVQEGGEPLEIAIRLQRGSAHRLPVMLEAQDISGDSPPLSITLEDNNLTLAETATVLRVSLSVGALPLQPGSERTVELVATDLSGTRSEQTLTLAVSPTALPDVYLLAGQSNMVGYSGAGTKRSAPGQPDAPHAGIWQLNVQDNTPENFPVDAAFTAPSRIALAAPRFVLAEDPLHEGIEQPDAGKLGDFIGPGLSFAKQAARATSADIYLVPAAWSDTGFCARVTSHLDELGWHAEQPAKKGYSGTLLLDRAIARTNLVLEETGGILRGILWHQGEADTGERACAEAYAAHLEAMVRALRTRIIEDARGSAARGPAAQVPFVLGTMSRGGDLADFDATKQTVDDVHRSVSALIPFATFVNNDDLVPPAYACGQGNCIHFGAAAYREMGARYHAQLLEAAES